MAEKTRRMEMTPEQIGSGKPIVWDDPKPKPEKPELPRWKRIVRALQRDLICGIVCGAILLAAINHYPVDYVTAPLIAIAATWIGRLIFRLTLRWGIV